MGNNFLFRIISLGFVSMQTHSDTAISYSLKMHIMVQNKKKSFILELFYRISSDIRWGLPFQNNLKIIDPVSLYKFVFFSPSKTIKKI